MEILHKTTLNRNKQTNTISINGLEYYDFIVLKYCALNKNFKKNLKPQKWLLSVKNNVHWSESFD